MLLNSNDPIVAIATAPGRGAVGIVRASGADLSSLISAVCGTELFARHATYLAFRDAAGQTLDQGLAIHFPAPRSYTGEAVLELQAHGGPVVMQLLLARCLEAGAGIGLRLARPGEFSERAFLNDKLDLAQAEAVADLIAASTEAAARSAGRSLSGAFSAELHALAQRIVNLRVLVEATLDFPEEEIDFLERADADGQLARIVAAVAAVRARARQGALLNEGLRVVLAGQPNVGKSSLLNALAGAELAIVTAIPGTTRDRIHQTIQIEGVPIHIVDTAGLREESDSGDGSGSADEDGAAVGDGAASVDGDAAASGDGPIAALGGRSADTAVGAIDEVERIGIARSWEAIADADAILFLHDLTRRGDPTYEAAEAAIAQRLATAPRGHVIEVDNKVDAVVQEPASEKAEADARRTDSALAPPANSALPPAATLAPDDGAPGAAQTLKLSAKTGQGLAELRAALLAVGGWTASPEGVFIARSRHLDALSRCAEHLAQAAANAHASIPALDLFAEDLRGAHDALGEITGAFTPDDLLGQIFGRFCIGK